MVIKQCLKKGICGKVYKEGDDGYELNYCKLCGAPLEEKETKDGRVVEDKNASSKSNGNQEKKIENVFIDKYGYVHLSESEMNKAEKMPKFIVYNGDVVSGVIEMEKEKAIIDNNSLGIELRQGSNGNSNSIEEVISVYNEKGEYYIEKVSGNGSVLLNNEPIHNNTKIRISNGEILVLSSNNWIEFEMN